MIVVMTSWAPVLAFKIPGTAPHKLPPTNPARTIRARCRGPGRPPSEKPSTETRTAGRRSSRPVVTRAPAPACPSVLASCAATPGSVPDMCGSDAPPGFGPPTSLTGGFLWDGRSGHQQADLLPTRFTCGQDLDDPA